MVQESSSKEISRIQNIINTLIVLQSHLGLYGLNNKNIDLTTARLCLFLEQHFAEQGKLTLHVARHGLLYKSAFVDRKNSNFAKFAYRLFQHGVAALSIRDEVSPKELQDFLLLVNRKPSETWDEGGIDACLASRHIARVVVREMVDQDILLSDELSELDDDELLKGRSRLWDKFALSVYQSLRLEAAENYDLPEGTTPQMLATVTNESLEQQTSSEQSTFTRDASRFLMSLKHEPVREYQNAALKRLISYVNHLSPAIRKMFLNNAFNLNVNPELIEKFLTGLTDDVILQALEEVSSAGDYTPPIVTKLLGKLAQSRGLEAPELTVDTESDLQLKAGKIKELFKPDDFQKYVPDSYQKILFGILHSESLPEETMQKVAVLKKTLERDMLDDHLGAVLFDILRQAPDPESVAGVADNLISVFDFYLDTGSYRKVQQLYQRCLAGEEGRVQFAEVTSFVSSRNFTDKALDMCSQLDRSKLDELYDLIGFVGVPFVAPLLDRLSHEINRKLRMFYLTCLKGLGSLCLAEAVKRLDSHHWYVTRNIIYLLRELGDPGALPHVRKALGHQHARVYQEALKTCLLFKDRTATEHLMTLLDADNTQEVINAVGLAGLSESKPVFEKLLSLLKDTSLGGDQLSIRKAVVRALGLRAHRSALPLLSDLLVSKSFLRPQKSLELKLEIVSSLDKYPAADVVDILRVQVQSRSPELSHQARLVLKRLERGQA